ncbi:unnamed protein product, partial [marine sediment metagenome]
MYKHPRISQIIERIKIISKPIINGYFIPLGLISLQNNKVDKART